MFSFKNNRRSVRTNSMFLQNVLPPTNIPPTNIPPTIIPPTIIPPTIIPDTIIPDTIIPDTILIVISSKSPNKCLYDCIDNLYKIQIKNSTNYKICVVDSDSNDLTIYENVKSSFPLVEIDFVKNKNYEYGAWNYAYSKYPNYDIYMCIQDSIKINKKIPFNIVNNNNSYIFYHHSGYNSDPPIKNAGIQNLKNCDLNYKPIIDTNFCLAQHSSFIVSNSVIKDIFNTLQIPPIDKIGSCFYERNFGLFFILKNIITHNMYDFFTKIHGGRI